MSMSNPTDIVEASAAVAGLPDSCPVILADGTEVQIQRLSWLKFELIWTDLAAVLAALLAAGDDATPEQLLGSLGMAPGVVLKLVCLTTGRAESVVANMSVDDVLEMAAAAIQLNFVNSAGVRGFFTQVAKLAAVAE